MKIIFKDGQELEISNFNYRYDTENGMMGSANDPIEQYSVQIYGITNAVEVLSVAKAAFTPENISEVKVITEEIGLDEEGNEIVTEKAVDFSFSKLISISMNLSDTTNNIDIRLK